MLMTENLLIRNPVVQTEKKSIEWEEPTSKNEDSYL
jgi:hypothetical protein